MVVGRTGVVNTPKEVVQTVALEHVGSLAECIVLQGAALRGHQCYATLLETDHVVVELGTGHVSVTPVEVADAGIGIGKHIYVDLLSVTLTLGQIVYEGLIQSIGEGTFGIVSYSYTDSLTLLTACIAAEVEEIFRLVVDRLLDDGRCPSITAGP